MLFFLGCIGLSFSQEPSKYGLIIAVSEYQEASITPLASDKDAQVLKQLFQTLGIPSNHILHVGKKEATREGIIQAWENLNSMLTPGSFVHIHYSGHGAQVPDTNGDEIEDGLDEVWVSYDAQYQDLKLDPTTVVLDDEVEQLQIRTRTLLGPNGQMFITTDACHNATATRSLSDKVVTRFLRTEYPTTIKQSSPNNTAPVDPALLAPIVHISASQDNEEAAEVKIEGESLGGLTYALQEQLPNLRPESTYYDLFENIVLLLERHTPAQHPSISGAQNLVFAQNKFLFQEPHLRIKNILGNTVFLNGGRYLGLEEGAVVSLYNKGTRSLSESSLIDGVVSKAGEKETKVRLEGDFSVIDYKSPQNYWAFIKHKSFRTGGTRVFLEDLSEQKIKEFEEKRESMPLVVLKEDKSQADLAVRFSNGGWFVRDLRFPTHAPNAVSLEDLAPQIQSISTRQYLSDFMLQYQKEGMFQVKVLTDDGTSLEKNTRGGYSLQPGQEFRFQLTNNSSKKLFVSLINIDDNKKLIEQLLPNEEEMIESLGVPAGKTIIFPDTKEGAFTVDENSTGMEKALFVANPRKAVDFSPLNTRGDRDLTQRTRSILDPIVSLPTTRSFRRKKSPPVFMGYTDTVLFYINMEGL